MGRSSGISPGGGSSMGQGMYRLPEGGETDDMTEYLDAWDELISFIQSILPGYTVAGCDPGLLMVYDGQQTVNMPTHMALTLRDTLRKEGCR